MSRPWIAKITQDADGYPEWNASDVYDLLGNDHLFDQIDVAAKKGKSFDLRPIVSRYLRAELNSLEYSLDRPAPLEILNTVRQSVGLRPLTDSSRYRGARKVAKAILESLARAGFTWTQTHLSRPSKSSGRPGHKAPSRGPSRSGEHRRSRRTYVFSVLVERPFHLRALKASVKSLPLLEVKRNFSLICFKFLDNDRSIELEAERTEITLSYHSGRSDKVWSVRRQGRRLWISFGRRDAKPKVVEKQLSSSAEATTTMLRLVEAKRKKGYVERVP